MLGAALEKLKSKGKKVKKKAKCLYDFDAKKPGHMSISEGTMVDIVDDSGPWWRARNPSTGEEGLIPSNYVEVVEGAGAGKKRLEEEDWFEPKIDRRDAESRVSRNAVGSFLVRPSKSHAGSFTLTARYPPLLQCNAKSPEFVGLRNLLQRWLLMLPSRLCGESFVPPAGRGQRYSTSPDSLRTCLCSFNARQGPRWRDESAH